MHVLIAFWVIKFYSQTYRPSHYKEVGTCLSEIENEKASEQTIQVFWFQNLQYNHSFIMKV